MSNPISRTQALIDVRHIFESGANDIRFVELIIHLTERAYNAGYDQGWRDSHSEAMREINKNYKPDI